MRKSHNVPARGLVAAGILLGVLAASASGVNDGWTFSLVDADGVRRAPVTVNLPHDWAIGGRFNPKWNPRQGALPASGEGTYVKTLELAQDSWLEFGGVMDRAKVLIDGSNVCERPYGYSSFRVAVPHGRHEVRVTASPKRDNARWYPGAGIFRPLRLVPRTPGEILPEDVFITTPEVSAARATVRVSHPGGERTFTVENPRLWSPEDPHLYTLSFGGRTYRYGIRTLAYDPSRGFFLNGRHRQFRGVCLHHDLGVLGAAFETTAARRQLRILKEMGCDAIRTSHNPPAPELLDLCDEMGLMVMDEAFDCWELKMTDNDYAAFFPAWHERDLSDLVRRDRNHPCVVMWSVGNEVMECHLPTMDTAVRIGRELTEIVHRLDPTRPVTIASFRPDTMTNGFAAATDVFGANYLPGRYAEFLRTHPGKGLVGTETCSTVSSRGEYFLPIVEGADMRTRCKDLLKMVRGAQVSGYDLWGPHSNDYPPDVEFAAQRANPQVYGEFVWTGFDYLGEPDPCAEADPPARSAYFGIFDLCGFPKDRYWLYRSVWRADVPTAHILPHWNWEGREGEVTPVHVYSSGDEAELFVNGVSQGRHRRGPDEYRFRWDDVRYAPGEVAVRTWRKGRPWAEDRRVTAGAPAVFTVTAENPDDDLVYYRIEVLDAKGNPAPRADNRFAFRVSGGFEFVGACNGDPSDYDAFRGGSLRAFNGLCQVVVRRRPGASDGVLEVSSPGLARRDRP